MATLLHTYTHVMAHGSLTEFWFKSPCYEDALLLTPCCMSVEAAPRWSTALLCPGSAGNVALTCWLVLPPDYASWWRPG